MRPRTWNAADLIAYCGPKADTRRPHHLHPNVLLPLLSTNNADSTMLEDVVDSTGSVTCCANYFTGYEDWGKRDEESSLLCAAGDRKPDHAW